MPTPCTRRRRPVRQGKSTPRCASTSWPEQPGDPRPVSRTTLSPGRSAEASCDVTAAQVDAVRAVVGSDRAAFEVIMAASIGPGLNRWDAATRAIEEADDAAT